MVCNYWSGKCLFSPSLSTRASRSSLLSTAEASNTPIVFLSQKYINSQDLGHNLAQRNTDCLFLPQEITLIHWPSEQEVATILDLLVIHLHIKGWEINMTKIQRLSTSVKFLGVQCCGACQDMPSKGKNSCCIRLLLQPRKRHNV